MRLDRETLLEVVRYTPLVSVDLIVRNSKGQVLVGLRSNEPAKGMWFVPGGRICKDERIVQAIARVSLDELGVDLSAEASLLGVYEHLYDTNFAGAPDVGTHYVVLAYQAGLADGIGLSGDDQHSQFRWAAPADLLADDSVHPNTQAYFR